MGVVPETKYCLFHPDVVIARTNLFGNWQYYPCILCEEQEAMKVIERLKKGEHNNEQTSD